MSDEHKTGSPSVGSPLVGSPLSEGGDGSTPTKKPILFKLPPPPPKPVEKIPTTIVSVPLNVQEERKNSISNPAFSNSSSSLLSNSSQNTFTTPQVKASFNFPKFAAKKTRIDEIQNFAKLIPVMIKKKDSDTTVMEKDDFSGSEDEDENSNQAQSLVSLIVNASFLKRTETIKIPSTCLTSEAIKIITKEMNIDTEAYPLADLKLSRVARGNLGSSGDNRVWLDNNTPIQAYKLLNGDEVKLKSIKEKYVIQICKPPSPVVYSFTYDFNTTVKMAILNLLKDSNQIDQVDRFGLYYQTKGLWLDDTKTLEYYEIDQQHVIDLRALSQEILLRIFLPQSPNKVTVTLKVVKSQTVGEIIQMINKKVSVENMHLFYIYNPADDSWLDESQTLEDCKLQTNSLLEYKLKYKKITVNIGGEDKTVSFLIDYRDRKSVV